MIHAVAGPLISRPDVWTLVFKRTSSSRFRSFIALGRYKHVCAYGYVPFLHVWVFFDPHWEGNAVFIAADGEAAKALIKEWIVDADLIRMPQLDFRPIWTPPIFGWCTPSIRRLIGLPGGALRCDALWRQCLEHGGEPFERNDGPSSSIRHG